MKWQSPVNAQKALSANLSIVIYPVKSLEYYAMEQPSQTDSRPSTKPTPQWIGATRVVILVAFLDLFMQFPVIAPYARTLGATGTLVGVVVAAYSGANLIGNLVAGAILDKWGRKKPLLVGLLATALALLGYALSATPQQLVVVRALHGLAAAILTPGAFAILGDSARAGQRARVMGISGAFIAAAAVIGPLIAGIVRDKQSPEAVFLLSATIMLGTFFIFWYSVRKLVRMPEEISPQDDSRPEAASRGLPRLVTSYLAALALTVGLGTLVTHLPIVLAERGESATRTGLTFTAFAVVAMIAMASPLSRVSDRFGRLVPMMAGLVSVSAGMLVLWASGGFPGAVLGMGIFGLGFGVLFPAMTALAAESVQQNQRGKAFGIFFAVFSVGVVIGAMFSGLLADRLGTATVLPYLISAIFALAIVPTIGVIWRLQKARTSGD